MKLTKKLEAEIKQVMDTSLGSYLNGELKKWASFLPPNYKNIGTTQEEIWNSKKAIVDYTNRVSHQLQGMAEVRHKKTQIFSYAPYIMVQEFGDLYIKNGNHWVFYAKLRLSSLIEKTGAGWKILHQHGSYPDSKAEEGETFAFDKISKENLELKEAVKRRTAELENKTRELEIETSLERVRTVAMGMNKPDDIMSICKVTFTELKALGFKQMRNALINFWDDENSLLLDYDYSDFSGENFAKLPYSSHPAFEAFQRKIRKAKDAFVKLVIAKDQLKSWKKRRKSSGEYDDPRLHKISALYYYFYSTGVGGFGISTFDPISNENIEVLKRFRNVFDLAYRRYIDIQKAEAQAREAQIEVSLERVRARTMAMYKSEDLADLSLELVKQVQALGVATWFCAFNIYDDDKSGSLEWGSNGQGTFPKYRTPREGIFLRYYEAGQGGKEFLINEIGESECPAHYNYLCSLPGVGEQLLKMKNHGIPFPTSQVDHVAFFKYGYILFITYDPVPGSHDIFKRFARVFEQTYTRFLDLQKAEAQAREAQIEAALEKVRSRAMAMHSSQELIEVALELRNQMALAEQHELEVCAIHLYDESPDYFESWAAIRPPHLEGKFVQVQAKFPKRGIKIVEEMMQKYHSGKKDYVLVNEGEKVPEWLAQLKEKVPEGYEMVIQRLNGGKPEDSCAYWSIADFEGGALVMTTYIPPMEDARHLLRRFANVFGLAYRRFVELRQAEAQAREAQIEASLERVRSGAMAMHSSDDLAATIGSFYRELQRFSITPRRCGVGLLDQEERVGELFTWNKTDTGESFQLIGSIKMEGHPVLNQVYEHWLSKTEYHPVLRGNEIKEYYKILRPQIAFPDYPHDSVQYGYFFFFNEGGVYAWTEKEMKEDELQIYRRFTSVLSLTYKRYKDLKQAEAYATQAKEDLVKLQTEKKRAEDALAELQVTQKQLIQSEKMASLGELTAGIAHEIQNPLNFVNNFSDVSNELIDEMKVELDKGEIEEAKAIAGNVKQNLEKITHHGKRADAIVKGMLQHSRSSSGIKEPTDINALCDEYLRLSYHGLRAKDKSFNATMKTDFDTNIDKINIVPQDLGRAILNLLTNAFYAVHEKKKSAFATASADKYEPIVSVSTKREKDKVEIKVTDNGNGIPEKILDKIFQPFFTTKPTGQGTGLGLSLSYDIISKGHGGELKAETTENEGTHFIIILPY